MSILVTRPSPAGEELVSRLRTLGQVAWPFLFPPPLPPQAGSVLQAPTRPFRLHLAVTWELMVPTGLPHLRGTGDKALLRSVAPAPCATKQGIWCF